MGWTKGRGVHVGCSGGGIIGAANLLAPPLITALRRGERVVGHQLASHLLVHLFGSGLYSKIRMEAGIVRLAFVREMDRECQSRGHVRTNEKGADNIS